MSGEQLAHLPLDRQLTAFQSILCQNQTLVKVLEAAVDLDLPNWYLAAGAITQTIWNHVLGLPLEHGISDYDIVYHDGSDLSYEAENEAIERGAAACRDISSRVEIRNQARVHLWSEAKFRVPCPQYMSTEEGIDCFASNTAMVGVRIVVNEEAGKAEGEGNGDWKWHVYAPIGLSNMFRRVVRPNPAVASREAYEKKTARWEKVWPGLTVHG